VEISIDKIRIGQRTRKNNGDIAALAKSISDIGLLHPIVIDPDYNLIAGQRRIEAHKHLGRNTIEARIVDNLRDAYKLIKAERDENVCRMNFTPTEAVEVKKVLEPLERAAAAARIAKNQFGANSINTGPGKLPEPTGESRDKVAASVGMSASTLKKAEEVCEAYNQQPDLFREIIEEMDKTGNVSKANKKMKRILYEQRAEKENNEPVEIAPHGIDVQYGDIWQLGNHKIMCGDAYNNKDVAALMDGEKVTALISDPPYGIEYKPDWNKWDGSPSTFSTVTGDDKRFDPHPFLSYPVVALFGANYFSDLLPIGGWICWDKRTDSSKDEMFGSAFELAWYRSKHTTRKSLMIRILHGGVVNADSKDGNNQKRFVATQKPVLLIETILDRITSRQDIIYDPFIGSGSTLLACENKGRKSYAMDIEPSCVLITIGRWQDQTSGEPVLLRRLLCQE